MLQNPVKRKFREGKAVVGTWLNLGDPIAAEAVAALGGGRQGGTGCH